MVRLRLSAPGALTAAGFGEVVSMMTLSVNVGTVPVLQFAASNQLPEDVPVQLCASADLGRFTSAAVPSRIASRFIVRTMRLMESPRALNFRSQALLGTEPA